MKQKLLTILLSVTLASKVYAATWLDIHVASLHTKGTYTKNKEEHKFNELNLGLGLDIERGSKSSYVIGAYNNSYGKPSVYTGMDFHTDTNKHISFGIGAGLVSGYANTKDTSSSAYLKPMILPNITIKYENIRTKIGIAPTRNGALTLSLSYKL